MTINTIPKKTKNATRSAGVIFPLRRIAIDRPQQSMGVGHDEPIQTNGENHKIEVETVHHLDQRHISSARTSKNAADPPWKHVLKPQNYLTRHEEDPPPCRTVSNLTFVYFGNGRLSKPVDDRVTFRSSRAHWFHYCSALSVMNSQIFRSPFSEMTSPPVPRMSAPQPELTRT